MRDFLDRFSIRQIVTVTIATPVLALFAAVFAIGGWPAVKDFVLVILIGGLIAFAAFFPPWLLDYIDDRKSREFWEKNRKEASE